MVCRNMQKAAQAKGSEEKTKDAIDFIKTNSKSKSVKISFSIVTAVLKQISHSDSCRENESEIILIIESLCPYLSNCIMSQLKGVQGEWYVYKVTA